MVSATVNEPPQLQNMNYPALSSYFKTVASHLAGFKAGTLQGPDGISPPEAVVTGSPGFPLLLLNFSTFSINSDVLTINWWHCNKSQPSERIIARFD